MARPEKIKLGEALLNQKVISSSQLEHALSLQGTSKRKLGKILIEQKYVTEVDIANAIAKQLNIEFVNLKRAIIDPIALHKITEIQARKYKSLVLKENNDFFIVAMSDPSDIIIYDDLVKILNKEINIVCVTEEDIFFIIDKFYKSKDSINGLAKEVEQDIKNISGINVTNNDLTLEDAPVIKLLQNIFEDAVKQKASDIHIEPQKENTIIRFRVDGVLKIHTTINKQICAPLISRLKIISKLDFSEKRLPQDGRFQIIINQIPLNVRISTLNEYFGEAAVLRLLTQNNNNLDLNTLGMNEAMLTSYKEKIEANEGMILVVGPTGSGKTTTLYASLAYINNVNKKIITIEDPIEYQIDMINQIQVNEKIDLTFSKILRAVLRQDPDVILVGEIRDTETAQVALRSSITGHLLFSTLHTKNTISTPARLIDMGIPSYMIASALQGILSQRLVRTNCKECISKHEPDKKDLLWLEKNNKNHLTYQFKKGKGCSFCHNTGYNGRLAIYEFLELDNDLVNALYHNDLSSFQSIAEKKLENQTMLHSLFSLVEKGITSVDEARRMGL